MSASFADILKSRMFKFIVGKEADGLATEFFVHEEAVAQLSESPKSELKGEMIEAQVGCTNWDHVSKSTFEHFIQFAYTGDYSISDAIDEGEQEGVSIPNEQCLKTLEEASLVAEDSKPADEEIWSTPVEAEPAAFEDDGWGDFASWTKSKKGKGKKTAKARFIGWDECPVIGETIDRLTRNMLAWGPF